MSSPAEVRVRRMCAADLVRVVEIAAALTQAPKWPASAYVAAMDQENTPRRVALVAEYLLPPELKPDLIPRASVDAAKTAPFQGGGRVFGFAVASLLPPEAELETIAVAKEGQRHGIASLLLRALIQELEAERVSRLALEVRASNQAALRFYQARGFKQTGRRPRYYADPEEDAVLLELTLP
jgi:ribosomal-protein-alanine N-acetyltransferase